MHRPQSELVRAVFAEYKANGDGEERTLQLSQQAIENLIPETLQLAARVSALLSEKVTPDEAQAYFSWLEETAESVCEAAKSGGGILGIGNDHYPLPWQSLKYDTRLGGYVTGVTENQLRGAPRYGNDNDWNWGDPARARAVNDYYGVPMA